METPQIQDWYTKSSFLILEFPKSNSFEVILKLKDFKTSSRTIPKHFKRISPKNSDDDRNQAIVSLNEPLEHNFENTKRQLVKFLEENKISHAFFVLEIPINEPKTKAK